MDLFVWTIQMEIDMVQKSSIGVPPSLAEGGYFSLGVIQR